MPQPQLKDFRTAVSTSESLELSDACLRPASPSNKSIPFPSLHPPSVLPHPQHHTSVSLPQSSATSDEYSWEWGRFPQRSQIRMEYTLPSTTPMKTERSTETDEQLVVSQMGEFQRSKSLPPEFELEVTGEVASTSLPSNEQQELLSDVETGFDHDSGMLGRESKSWARWWRRDNRHARRLDIRDGRLLQSTESVPLSPPELRASVPSPFPGKRPKMRYAKSLRLTSEQLVSITKLFWENNRLSTIGSSRSASRCKYNHFFIVVIRCSGMRCSYLHVGVYRQRDGV